MPTIKGTWSTKDVWYATTNTTTTTTGRYATNTRWSNELKCMKNVVIKHEIPNPLKSKILAEMPKKKVQKKKEGIPLGARMPNIHSDEISWGQNHFTHSWCGRSRGLIGAPYLGHETKGKPFCLGCKRFLSKRAVKYLREHEAEGVYIGELEAHLALGLIITYYAAQKEKPNEDCTVEPPLSERVDGAEW